MAKPTSLPRWATALLSPSDIVEPGSTKKDNGWLSAEEPPHSYFNWLFNTIYLWTVYLDGLTNEALTWTVVQTFADGLLVGGGDVSIDGANLVELINISGGITVGSPMQFVSGADILLNTGSGISGTVNSSVAINSTSGAAGAFTSNTASGTSAALVASNTSAGNNAMYVPIGAVKIGTGSVNIGLGDVNLTSGSVNVSSGDVNLNTAGSRVRLLGASGEVTFSNASPVTSGANRVTVNNICAARVTGSCASGAFTIDSQHNIATVDDDGANIATFTFTTPMSNANYTVVQTITGPAGTQLFAGVINKSTTEFELKLNAGMWTDAGPFKFDVVVFGIH